MVFTLQEQTLIQHFKQHLSLVKDPKRQLALSKHLVSFAVDSIYQAKRQRSREAYQKRKAEEIVIKPKLQLIAKLSLNPGDIIRIKGTRDSGMREVIGFKGIKVVCHQLTGVGAFPWIKTYPTLDSYRRSGYKTINDLSKITHIVENNKWCHFVKKLK